MNLETWAVEVCRIRDLLHSTGVVSAGNTRVESVTLERRNLLSTNGKDAWIWIAKCDYMSASEDTAHAAVSGLLKMARDRLKQALERMQALQTLEVQAAAMLAEDDGDLT